MPDCILTDGRLLLEVKDRLAAGGADLKPAYDALIRDAEAALSSGPFSVTSKASIPPSGDKHDYMSRGPYWWPNPATPDGLPYIRKDGQHNPDAGIDRDSLGKMNSAVCTLALADWLSGRHEFAQHAVELLRAWFLDPRTKMNPHLNYAQAVPGRNDGRGIGIIDMSRASQLIDAIVLLRSSGALPAEDEAAIRHWFEQYLQWLLESPNGQDARAAKNNHGSWYDVQVCTYAIFLGKVELARQVLEKTKLRIDSQIQPDGSQPHELGRTNSLGYCTMNANAMLQLATLGSKVGVDLANYVGPQGQSIRKAIGWLSERYTDRQPWEHEQISRFNAVAAAGLLRQASLLWHEPAYERMIAQFPAESSAIWAAASREQLVRERMNLIMPALMPHVGKE